MKTDTYSTEHRFKILQVLCSDLWDIIAEARPGVPVSAEMVEIAEAANFVANRPATFLRNNEKNIESALKIRAR